MGLDISYYSGLKLAADQLRDEPDYDMEVKLYIDDEHFIERADHLKKGIYTFKTQASFRAGSYSGYNRWREWLANLAGYKNIRELWSGRITSGPFYELINFSDCEGTIGPTTSAKLAQDFAQFAERAGDDQIYARFKKAFEVASDGGAVQFH